MTFEALKNIYNRFRIQYCTNEIEAIVNKSVGYCAATLHTLMILLYHASLYNFWMKNTVKIKEYVSTSD